MSNIIGCTRDEIIHGNDVVAFGQKTFDQMTPQKAQRHPLPKFACSLILSHILILGVFSYTRHKAAVPRGPKAG